VFAIKATAAKVWIGTENGLACYDKESGTFVSWKEEDGLPFQVVSALDIDPKTGDLWIGLFGGGLARFSGGRFDHFHQLNSGLVNDVVYGVAVENDNIWAATTAGASRYNTITKKWSIYTEKNAPMEEIWNYGVSYADGKVYLGVWGSGVLEFDVATEKWLDYLDPDGEMEIDLYRDGEMEIDLYRDDGIVHVITTGTSYVDKTLWVSTYFGMCRYDGRNWRGLYKRETGLPSDFGNSVKGRSANEAWYATDKGVGVVADFPTDTWVTYTMDPQTHRGQAVIQRGAEVLRTIEMERSIPHNYSLWVEFDGDDVWVGTSKGLALAKGAGYFRGLRPAQADDLAQGK
jgi:ligand-binding sensor domain-containing protein